MNALFRLAAVVSFCSSALVLHAATIFDVRIPSEFNKVVDTNTAVLTTNASVTLGTGTTLEGPTWVPGSPGYLLFSTFTYMNYGNTYAGLRKLVLPNTLTTNLLAGPNIVYNGSTLDNQERFISCQAGQAGQRVVMISNNNVVTPLVTTCGGKEFYSPNDVVVKSDGTIWFTDPNYNSSTSDGAVGYATGHNVYRFDPSNGNATCTAVLAFDYNAKPNGLCFSPGESLLYLAESATSLVLVYSISSSNTLSGASVFATIPNGAPDGIRCDADGRVYSSSGNGVYVYMPYPDRRLIGHIITPNTVNNLCFGGADGRTLFVASAPNIISIPLKVTGTRWIKKLQITQMEDSSLHVSWPWPSTGFQLQTSPNLDPGTWSPVDDVPFVTNGLNLLKLDPSTNSAAFFQLCLPSP
jgi:gluconolactonase